MYTLPTSNQLRRSFFVNSKRVLPKKLDPPPTHQERVLQELRNLGASRSAMQSGESRYLPELIHKNESLGGVVYGHHKDGFAMLVATNRRVIFLDKKPMFFNEDEISYDVISGVNFSHVGFGSTVILHSRIKDYALKTLNRKCAEEFVGYIETRCLELEEGVK